MKSAVLGAVLPSTSFLESPVLAYWLPLIALFGSVLADRFVRQARGWVSGPTAGLDTGLAATGTLALGVRFRVAAFVAAPLVALLYLLPEALLAAGLSTRHVVVVVSAASAAVTLRVLDALLGASLSARDLAVGWGLEVLAAIPLGVIALGLLPDSLMRLVTYGCVWVGFGDLKRWRAYRRNPSFEAPLPYEWWDLRTRIEMRGATRPGTYLWLLAACLCGYALTGAMALHEDWLRTVLACVGCALLATIGAHLASGREYGNALSKGRREPINSFVGIVACLGLGGGFLLTDYGAPLVNWSAVVLGGLLLPLLALSARKTESIVRGESQGSLLVLDAPCLPKEHRTSLKGAWLDKADHLGSVVCLEGIETRLWISRADIVATESILDRVDHAGLIIDGSALQHDYLEPRRTTWLVTRLLRSAWTAVDLFAAVDDPVADLTRQGGLDPRDDLQRLALKLRLTGTLISDLPVVGGYTDIRERLGHSRVVLSSLSVEALGRTKSLRSDLTPSSTHAADQIAAGGVFELALLHRQVSEQPSNAGRLMALLDLIECQCLYLVALLTSTSRTGTAFWPGAGTDALAELTLGKCHGLLQRWVARAGDQVSEGLGSRLHAALDAEWSRVAELDRLRELCARGLELRVDWPKRVRALDVLGFLAALRNRTRGHGAPSKASDGLAESLHEVVLELLGRLDGIGGMIAVPLESADRRWFLDLRAGGCPRFLDHVEEAGLDAWRSIAADGCMPHDLSPFLSPYDEAEDRRQRAAATVQVNEAMLPVGTGTQPWWIEEGGDEAWCLARVVQLRNGRLFLLSKHEGERAIFVAHSTGEVIRPEIRSL